MKVNAMQASKGICRSRPAIITGKTDASWEASVKRTEMSYRGSGDSARDNQDRSETGETCDGDLELGRFKVNGHLARDRSGRCRLRMG